MEYEEIYPIKTIIKPSDVRVAHTEINIDSAISLNILFKAPPFKHASSFLENRGLSATIPKVEESESKNPISATIIGLIIPRTRAANPSELTGSAFLPKRLPARITRSIIPALQTDGEKPVTPMKNKVNTIPITEFSLFLTLRSSSIE